MAPKIFGLCRHDERTPFLKAIKQLRIRVGINRENMVLDFSHTEKLYAEGTLLFLAELKRLIKFVKGGVELSCLLPKNNKVTQVLKQIRVLEILGVTTDIKPEDDDVVNWRCAYGSKVLGEKYEDVLSEYDGEITELLQNNLYTGITEAMANVLNHAYDLEREDNLNAKSSKDWWMFSQQHNNMLTVVFCDLGAGIPKTLPFKQRGFWNKIIKHGITSDGEIIKYAVKDSISRTKKTYRGKGLRQIIQVIDGIPGASVLLLSNKGSFSQGSGSAPMCATFKDSILGTLIFWGIPLETKEGL